MEARRARRGTQAAARAPWGQDSAGDPAPGDVDGDAGEPGGGIGGEEERDLGDVVREAEPVQRVHGRNLLLHRGRHEPGDSPGGGMSPATRSVRMDDGAIALTRTPRGPISAASWRVSMTRPALATP